MLGAFGQRRAFGGGEAFDEGPFPPHCKTNAKYVKSKEKLSRIISCLFSYWEEGTHDHKGYTVVDLGDRSFHDVPLYALFLGHQTPSLECPGAVFGHLTLDQSLIVRPTRGKPW